jgi:hypothetical protein
MALRSRFHCLAPLFLALGVSNACAEIEGMVDLAWNECVVNSSTANRSFSCNEDAGVSYLAGMFTLTDYLAGFKGVSAFLRVTVDEPTLPSWWQFWPGACRAGAIGVADPSSLPGCIKPTNPFGREEGGAVQHGGALPPNQAMLGVVWYGEAFANLAGAVRYAGFVMSISNIHTVESPPDTGAHCAGCSRPACIEIHFIDILAYHGGARLTQPGTRSFVTWQGGTDQLGGCPGAVPVRKPTWGGIKSLYR